eukprot:TRINITY_DN64922_c0_g1_i1.p1 TRINITY_DN64922_c0_g1~~TRINITY_DN64922_c0_g1_i1.p1  ORF type:complete len:234 (+),score=83.66 TRINITY_DN64922_c0_g1_i1:47-703(+)
MAPVATPEVSLASQKHPLEESVGKGDEVPEWVVFDRKATVALQLAESLVQKYQLEMAKIASESLGPQDDEEKKAVADGWTFLEQALSMYNRADGFLDTSHKNVKSSLKEMEEELKALDDKDEDKPQAKQLMRYVKDFKKHQAEKMTALKEQIERIDSKLAPARQVCCDVWEKEFKEQQAGGYPSKEETEKEHLEENAPEAPTESSSADSKKKKNKNKK